MRILVTAGPTREYFDSVRFMSNGSSGKMGYAVAAQAARRGHEVTLVSGPVELSPPRNVKMVKVVSAKEMFEVAVDAFESADAAIMVAAVCDYRPTRRSAEKSHRSSHPIQIELEPTADICAHLGKIKGARVVVGFAMEDHDHHARAERKLASKCCDAIVLNSVGTLGSEAVAMEILDRRTGWSPLRQGSKAELASAIVDLIDRQDARSLS